MHWTVKLSWFYGLHLVAGDLEPFTVLRTLLIINICNAVMCRLFAHNSGYNKNWWTGLGFFFGIWAVAVLIVLPKRGAGSQSEKRKAESEKHGPGLRP